MVHNVRQTHTPRESDFEVNAKVNQKNKKVSQKRQKAYKKKAKKWRAEFFTKPKKGG